MISNKKSSVKFEELQKELKREFSDSQIAAIRKGYEDGLAQEQIDSFAKPEIPSLIMFEIMAGMKN